MARSARFSSCFSILQRLGGGGGLAALLLCGSALAAPPQGAPLAVAPPAFPPLSPEVLRAGAALRQGQAREAVSLLGACQPADLGCRIVLGRARFQLGDLAGALEALPTVPLPAPLGAAVLRMRGEALLIGGHPAQAAPLLRDAAADPGPLGAEPSGLLCDALLGAGALEEARAAIPAAHKRLGTTEATLALTEASILRGLADHAPGAAARAQAAQTAARAFRAFWLQHPGHPAADGEPAIEQELAALGPALPPPSPKDHLTRATRLLASGLPARAEQEAALAAPQLPQPLRAHASLLVARALAAQGRRGDEAPALIQAWQSGVADVAPQAGLLLARDRARRGELAEAITLLDRLRARYAKAPEAAEAAYLAARLESDAGHEAVAAARLKALARSDSPEGREAGWTLAFRAYRTGQPDSSRAFAAQASRAHGVDDRARALYWQARTAADPDSRRLLFAQVAALQPLGWYGALARAALSPGAGKAAPFPPPAAAVTLPPQLAPADWFARAGFSREASLLTDAYVHQHGGDAARLLPALSLYREADRPDRALLLAEDLVGRVHGHLPLEDGDGLARQVMQAAYPAAYANLMGEAAQKEGVDPYLLLAVARRESRFVSSARSAAGAIGLFQLLPKTARRLAAEVGAPPPSEAELMEPPLAIAVGARYLGKLLARFGHPAIALAAYNAGPAVAAPWAKATVGEPLDLWVEELPYKETRNYVKVVMSAYGTYRLLAGGSPPALDVPVPAPQAGVDY